MDIVDAILNVAGLLLWLNWRTIRFDPLTRRTPATLMGTLRPAAPNRLKRWHFLIFIAVLILGRAILYRWLGSATGSTTSYLDFGATVQGFRHDRFLQALAFSAFSFVRAMGMLYIVLIFLSILGGPEPINTLIKIPLGRLNEWPGWLKSLLPFLGTAVFWFVASWLFGIMQPGINNDWERRVAGAVEVGLSSYLLWKFPAGAILLLYLLSSYIYFGRHPIWNYVAVTGRNLLKPLRGIPLRAGQIDFAPLVGLTILFLGGEMAERGLLWLYSQRLFPR